MSGDETKKVQANYVAFGGVVMHVDSIERGVDNNHHDLATGRPQRTVTITRTAGSSAAQDNLSPWALVDIFENGKAEWLMLPGAVSGELKSHLAFMARCIEWSTQTGVFSAAFLEEPSMPAFFSADLVRGWVACEFGEEEVGALSELDLTILGFLLKLGRPFAITVDGIAEKIHVATHLIGDSLHALERKRIVWSSNIDTSSERIGWRVVSPPST